MLDGTFMYASQKFSHFDFFPPKKPIVLIFSFLETLKAFITLELLPEVVMPIATSPFFPNAYICLENKYLYPKSFYMALMALRLNLYLTVSSVAKC